MTILEFTSKVGHRARIWLDELPSAALVSNETVQESHVFECGSKAVRHTSIAIEVFRPIGPTFYYGLLGAAYQPAGRGLLEVAIPAHTPLSARLYSSSLAGALDTVRVGGLAEYTAGICDGLQRIEMNARPCGVVQFLCMAHGAVGSSPAFFGSLARALLLGLSRSDHPTSIDEVMALLAA